MDTSVLTDPVAVGNFIAVVHERAAAAVFKLKDSRPCVLQLCSMAPDDNRFFTSAYSVGDVEHMTTDALTDADAGKNVFLEGRLTRPSKFQSERGGLNNTLAVFAVVGDSDIDTGKPFAARTPASAIVETSPGNQHEWFFLRHAIGATDGQQLGQLMRQACGGDHCSGVVTQPYRLAGTPNYPDKKKQNRGRIVTPTRILRLTGKTYTAAELTAWFAADAPLPLESDRQPAAEFDRTVRVEQPAFCRSKARAILAGVPSIDRSAQFMSAVNYAALGGIPADEFEAIARRYSGGCAGKYLEGRDRLRAEIDRCYAKAMYRY
jgi:hypothetical protein